MGVYGCIRLRVLVRDGGPTFGEQQRWGRFSLALGVAAGVWNFFVAFREALWNFPRQDYVFKEFRGFPGVVLENPP